MSNYIHNENQRLLWKMAHQIPAFASLDLPKKELEFKQVVEYFYRTCGKQTPLTIRELQQLNRETLSVFLPKKQAQPLVQAQQPSMPLVQAQQPLVQAQQPSMHLVQAQQPSVPKAPMMVESRQDKSLRAFQERQNVYENMNKKPDLPNPEEVFGEKQLEEVKIQNMEELILQYQKQREIEFLPPPILPQTQTPKLKLLNETILTENDVQDLSLETTKKSVSWKPELIQPPEWQPKIESLEKKIQELENKNLHLERKLEYMIHTMESSIRNRDNAPKMMITQKPVEYPNQMHTILNEIIYKIERMDSIKNKMKMI